MPPDAAPLASLYAPFRAARAAGRPADAGLLRASFATALLPPDATALIWGGGVCDLAQALALHLRPPGRLLLVPTSPAEAAEIASACPPGGIAQAAAPPALAGAERLGLVRVTAARDLPALLPRLLAHPARPALLLPRPAETPAQQALAEALAEARFAVFDLIGTPLMPAARCARALRALPMPEIIALPPGQHPARAAARALSRLAPTALAWPSPPPTAGPRHILLIPGLAKAGTTFLFDQLAGQAPRFVTSRTKEANVFSREAAPRRSAYLARFPTLDPAAVLVDASPTYLETADVTVAARIDAVLGGDAVQALVLLRDPVDAVFSHYLHAMKSWIGRPSRDGGRPASHALTDARTLGRYLRRRAPALAALRQLLGPRLQGAPMAALFDGGVAALLAQMFGVPVAPFEASRAANPGGFVPAYIAGGSAGALYRQDGQAWRVPPGALLFVAEERSEFHPTFPEAEAASLVALGATYTREAEIPLASLVPAIEDHAAMAAILGVPPLTKPRAAMVRFSARAARCAPAILARLAPA
jgi:hypothetical protein